MLVVAERRAHGVPSALDRLDGAHSSLSPLAMLSGLNLVWSSSLLMDGVVGLGVITVILNC